jgi:predicted AlkP superfamily phosphohydrolase/phosphomutase
LTYACDHYDHGLLFFYFSSTDLQSHMFWWDSEDKHPTRSPDEAKAYFAHLQEIYQKMDSVIGGLLDRYGSTATLIAMSDHGFANFRRQFNLNSWLRENGYLGPSHSTSIMKDVDWSQTRAYGLGINGLYLNLKGREKYGIVESGSEREALLDELVVKLEAVRDIDNRRVIRKVHRAENAYHGDATAYAPDLIIGYCRDYRASWDTCLGEMSPEILFDNTSAWSADHCADASEVPGVIFCNKPIATDHPHLIDLAPTILTEFGLKAPSSIEGKTLFAT